MNPLTAETLFSDILGKEIRDNESMREIRCKEESLLLRWRGPQS